MRCDIQVISLYRISTRFPTIPHVLDEYDRIKRSGVDRLKVLSCCTNFPTKNYPTHGLFVRRRLEMVSRKLDLRFLNPQPFFPLIRQRMADYPLPDTTFPVDIRRMFYLPGIAKQWDGVWLERCVSRWVNSMSIGLLDDAILDAHFGYPEGVGCYRVARKRDIPLFITVRGLETELMRVPPIKKQMLEAFDYARGVIAVSDSLRNTLIENGVASHKVRVIGNGVDCGVYSLGDKSCARKKLGIDQNAKLIVGVGNVQHRKGYDILIDALSYFRGIERLTCVIIGGVNEPWFYDSLKERVKALNLQNNVRFLGQQNPDSVVEWLRAADSFVLPTRREGCCNAVLEALSTGVPVVTTPAGDNTKFIPNEINGIIVPHENPEALAKALERSMDRRWDPELIANSVRPFTWEGTAEKVIEYFYERLS